MGYLDIIKKAYLIILNLGVMNLWFIQIARLKTLNERDLMMQIKDTRFN